MKPTRNIVKPNRNLWTCKHNVWYKKNEDGKNIRRTVVVKGDVVLETRQDGDDKAFLYKRIRKGGGY